MSPRTPRRSLKQELLGIAALIVVACAAPTVLPYVAGPAGDALGHHVTEELTGD